MSEDLISVVVAPATNELVAIQGKVGRHGSDTAAVQFRSDAAPVNDPRTRSTPEVQPGHVHQTYDAL